MLPRGTYDWTEVTVSLDLDAQLAGEATFTIFSSISGTLWVDELTFLYDDDMGSMEAGQVQGPLAPYIGQLSQPTTFMEMYPPSEEECPDSITQEEALQDIEMLDYLFSNAYSGYYYWSGQGIDFEAVCSDLTELAQEEEMVSVADMERLIARGLSEVQDGHLGVQGHERHRFLRRTAPFFTDVIVERAATGSGGSPAAEYRVIRSSHEAVRPRASRMKPVGFITPPGTVCPKHPRFGSAAGCVFKLVSRNRVASAWRSIGICLVRATVPLPTGAA